MIPMVALRYSITITPRTETGATDDYGNPTMVDGAPTVVPAHISIVTSTETEILRETRVQIYSVVVSPDAVVDAFSKVEWDGKIMEVLGEPLKYWSRGVPHHCEFQAREILG